MITEEHSFAALEVAESVTPEQLLSCFEDYAVNSRAAINPRVVITIILRAALTTTHRAEMRRLCRDAIQWNTPRHPRTAQEYETVLDLLSRPC